METSTSALISKAVTRPTTASRMIGTPHRMIAIHAGSNGRGRMSKMLRNRAIPPITRKAISLFVPPHSSRFSSFCKTNPPLFLSASLYQLRLHYTYRGICCQERGQFFRSQERKIAIRDSDGDFSFLTVFSFRICFFLLRQPAESRGSEAEPLQIILANRSTAFVNLAIVSSASPCSMPSRTQ